MIPPLENSRNETNMPPRRGRSPGQERSQTMLEPRPKEEDGSEKPAPKDGEKPPVKEPEKKE